MLTVCEAIKGRRSIRKFAPDDVSEAMVEQMLEAAQAGTVSEQSSAVALHGSKRQDNQAANPPYLLGPAVYRGSTGSNYLLR